MLRPVQLLLLGFFLAVDAIRFQELYSEGNVHGVPLQKYAKSVNRLNEINPILLDLDTPAQKIEEIDWDGEGENHFLYQGDIALTEEQLDYLLEDFELRLAEKEGRLLPQRSYSIGINLWKHFPITWSIDEANPPEGGIEVVKEGISLWEATTCVTFKRSDDTTNGHLQFYANATLGFFSPIANAKFNKVSIPRGCGRPAIVAHEIGHSLGLFHTQSRPDANETIRVLWENTRKGLAYNFQTPPSSWKPTTLGIPYDVGSLLHYGRNTFSIDKSLMTIEPRDENYRETLGQRAGVAFTDAKEINMMYCNAVCPDQLPCLNGGYTDPKDCSKYRCPEGLGAKLCDTVASSAAQCGETKLNATEEFQTLEINGKLQCIYRITALKGKRMVITLQRTSFTGMNSQLGCDSDYVEVKYVGDLAPVGARFCSKSLDSPCTMISEDGVDSAYVLYSSRKSEYGFSLQYRYGNLP